MRAVDTATGAVKTVAGWVPGFQDGNLIARDSKDAASFVAAMFNTPRGVAVRAADETSLDVFVSDSANHAIRKIHVQMPTAVEIRSNGK